MNLYHCSVCHYFSERSATVCPLCGAAMVNDGPLLGHVTLDSLLDTYVRSLRARVRRETWQHYDTLIRQHILPVLGMVPVPDLTAEHVRLLLLVKLNDGFTPPTVREVRRILVEALQIVADAGFVPVNVAAQVDVPDIAQWQAEQARRYRHGC